MTTSIVQRVLERLVYEGLMIHNQLKGRRWRMTLADLMQAGQVEPRVWELLPGILLHRPTIVYQRQQDLRRYPELTTLLQTLPTTPPTETWQGVPIGDLRKAADRITQLDRHRRRHQRWRNINIRVSEDDLHRLQRLATREGKTQSEMLRTLIANAAG